MVTLHQCDVSETFELPSCSSLWVDGALQMVSTHAVMRQRCIHIPSHTGWPDAEQSRDSEEIDLNPVTVLQFYCIMCQS